MIFANYIAVTNLNFFMLTDFWSCNYAFDYELFLSDFTLKRSESKYLSENFKTPRFLIKVESETFS